MQTWTIDHAFNRMQAEMTMVNREASHSTDGAHKLTVSFSSDHTDGNDSDSSCVPCSAAYAEVSRDPCAAAPASVVTCVPGPNRWASNVCWERRTDSSATSWCGHAQLHTPTVGTTKLSVKTTQ